MNKEYKNGLMPELRFPDFHNKEAWGKNRIGEIVSFLSGFAFKSEFFSTSGKKLLIPKNFTKNGYANFSFENTKFTIEDCLEKYVCKKGDLLLLLTDLSQSCELLGRPLMLTKTDGEVLLNQRIVKIIPSYKVKSKFLHAFFNSHTFRKRIIETATGSTVRHSSNKIVGDTQVYLPSLDEQQKIADCLTSIDDLITAHTKKLDTLNDHKKGLMQQLFPADGEIDPRLRFPEFTGNWSYCSIQDLIDSNKLLPPKDGNHGNIHPKSSDFVKNGIPFIMASNIRNGEIDLIGCSNISKKQADALQKGFSKTGDVLLTHKGTVGEVVIVPNIKYPYIMLTPQVTYYRIINDDELSNQYLALAFQSAYFQSNLSTVSGGGTRAYVGITEQRKLKVWIPNTIDEQQRISELISPLERVIKSQSAKIKDLKNHKKGLTQKLFPSVNEKECND